ncbi:undecaprenyl-phosphate alpha-N-acetylglucosaminyl 1-phosphate transferase [Photobacterium sanctipauli]|uniref:Undecaprenyl-phosphate alpha-N-acetylglucosaminyl 1-phosphate transferase n=1 Tax=Photobacterium sanctipauli TaxID=1342794 RepID=A0A2T3NTB2_9GAMM|nr:UDP-N-acetylglucosamine--undecaprenyl-phosphate N-acetylglucosaminephosphotransferase [Photobacterium sanctipauli]PSW19477.1 undecaprenyl-phosphate alpha-N-acetylglucosaminyl 1-phosphate transferase [Photobacterium sanctipauli]
MDSRLTIIFFFSLLSLIVLRKLAKKVALVDIPTARKQHQGSIPLIGGISIFLSVCLAIAIMPAAMPHSTLYLLSAFILVTVGVIDDKYDISVKARLLVQTIVSITMITVGSMSLNQLGDIAGFGDLALNNTASYFVTTLAIIGAINAFNMVDGIDGLLGGLAAVTFSSLGILFLANNQVHLFQFCLVIVTAAIPYIMLNLGFPFGQRYKVFMGDAGSIFIGFTVIWLLICGSQTVDSSPLGNSTLDTSALNDPAFRPVTALWLIALPLMDMATIMIRRIRKGQSPFKPDREHLHHICQRLGLTPRMTLICICSFASLLAYVGIIGEQYQVAESIMFVSFVMVFVIYYTTICHIWRITTFIRQKLTSDMVTAKNDNPRGNIPK